MTTIAPKILVDITEAAEALSVRPDMIRQWEKSGKMPRPVSINGTRRWVLTDLEKWIEQCRNT